MELVKLNPSQGSEKDKSFMLEIVQEIKEQIEKGNIRTLAICRTSQDKTFGSSTCGNFLEIIGLLSATQNSLLRKNYSGEI